MARKKRLGIVAEKEHAARLITNNALLGIAKAYGEATAKEVQAKYNKVSKAWNLPNWYVSEESVIAILNYAVRNGHLRYERRPLNTGRLRTRHTTGYYICREYEEKTKAEALEEDRLKRLGIDKDADPLA